MRLVSVALILMLFGTLVLAACASRDGPEVTMYKTPTCGCCALYKTYLDRKGFTVNLVEVADITPTNERFGVPENMRTCHMSTVGKYFVEGHVPVEAVDKLLQEQPEDVTGIAVPGMPMGSPGMPGRSGGPIMVYAIHSDGTTTEFMQV